MTRKVMVVGAHPDDAEWYCGGSLAKMAQEGDVITLVICTEGDKGTYDPRTDAAALVKTRKREQAEAAKFLGVNQVYHLGYPDGELEATLELRKKLALLYRSHQPDLLITFDPWRRYELHPDHRAAGTAALDARLAAKMPLYYPDEQGYNAWAVGEIWLFETDAPNHFVDVTATMAKRLQSLKLHASQSVGDAKSQEFVTQMAREVGAKMGTTFGEEFHRIVIEGPLVRFG